MGRRREQRVGQEILPVAGERPFRDDAGAERVAAALPARDHHGLARLDPLAAAQRHRFQAEPAERLDETEAVRTILSAAGPGDSLALPVHSMAARQRVNDLLDRLQAQGWAAGDPLATD